MSYSAVKIEPLGKDNFDTWKIQIKALLIKNDAWKYVNGTKKKPEDGSNADAIATWETNDAKATSDLILAISTPELRQVKNCETSNEIWKKLHNVYESKGPARKANLLKSLILLKMKNGDDMRDHLRNFFEIVDKLEEMEMKVDEDMITILLLYSVPDEYESFRIAIETQEKLLSPENMKIKLLEEYEARKRNSSENVPGAMFIKKFPENQKEKYDKSRNSNEQYKNDSRNRFSCHACGKIGHFARECRSKFFRKENSPEASKMSEEAEPEIAMKIEPQHGEQWCLDSGASSHMCSKKEKFYEMGIAKSKTLNLASQNSTTIEGSGTVKLNVKGEKTAKLEETLFVPDLRSNLLSVGKIADHGFEIIFRKNEAIVLNPETKESVMTAQRRKDLYFVTESVESAEESRIAQTSPLQEWHERFGHLNEKDLKNLIRHQKVEGINIKAEEELPVCETCIKGKQTQKSYAKSETKSEEILDLIHTDVCGPMRVESLAGSRYFVTFIDDKSKWCEIYFMKKKSEVPEKFKEYKAMVERNTGKKIKIVRSDNGLEYVSHYLNDFLKQEGIKHELTVEYTPQQNGVAERKNRTLVEMARCMMLQSGISGGFWAEAILTANHIRNRCPSRSLNGEIPYTIWTKRTPVVSYFQTFGTIAFALDKKIGKGKFDPRSKKCIFIGYSTESKAYRLWDPTSRKIIRSRDVTFTGQHQDEKNYTEFIDENVWKKEPEVYVELDLKKPEKQDEKKKKEHEINEEGGDETENEGRNDEENENFMDNDSPSNNERVSSEMEENETPKTTRRGPGRPRKEITGKRGRPRKIFNELPSVPKTNSERKVEEKKENQDSEEEWYFANLAEQGDPQSAAEALASPEANEWREAMIKEYEALMRNETWIIVDRPKEKKIIESKWILRTKLKANGEVDRRKARLVAKGFTQRPGTDFTETFAPVARIGSIRMIMALAAEFNLEVHQLDFVSAYLNGDIEEEIYLEVPSELSQILKNEDYKKFVGEKACLLKKALYGLKQSGRQWYKKLDEKLKNLNLKPLNSDPCVYLHRENNEILIVIIYVDDLIVVSNSSSKMKNLKTNLSKSFDMKDLGLINFCLGIEFQQNLEEGEICMSQEKYTKEVLTRFNMENCKSVSTPLDPGTKLSKSMCPVNEKEEQEANKLPYQNLIGSLMYLAVSTRPDIAHAVSVLSQFNSNFGEQHWAAAKRVLRYLKGTEKFALVFRKSGKVLTGYADADWGSSVDDRRSYTGYAFFLGNAAVSWKSRKQRTVALSTTEAEYMALADASKEATYLRRFLHEVLGKRQPTTTIYNDNQGAGMLCKNPIFHNRTKHVDIRHHFVRERIEEGDVDVKYMSTEEMPADVLTKALSFVKHENCIMKLGVTRVRD